MTTPKTAMQALEQIAIVCTDNMDRDRDHRMALDFVRQVANDCLSRCEVQTAKADYKIGWWLSGALEDPNVCAEMKADINAWFEAHQPGLVMPSPVPSANQLCACKASQRDGQHMAWCPVVTSTHRGSE
ncbi:MAG: hypothetical protein WC807_14745 [Hyphomicrobium sp.]|jgi:hypothetical protein